MYYTTSSLATAFGYHLSLDPLRFPQDQVVGDSRVAVRGNDRGMPQHLVEGGETTASFEPLTSERVTQLVQVAPVHTRLPPHRRVELPR